MHYAVNARFSTPPTPDTEYDVVKRSKKLIKSEFARLSRKRGRLRHIYDPT
jgi:hypothetical protein